MNVVPHPTIRARSLANVLADLEEARRDVDQAHEELRHATLGMPDRYCDDLQDRATEAETRLEDLREEFDAKFLDATGLTIANVWKAREDAVL